MRRHRARLWLDEPVFTDVIQNLTSLNRDPRRAQPSHRQQSEPGPVDVPHAAAGGGSNAARVLPSHNSPPLPEVWCRHS